MINNKTGEEGYDEKSLIIRFNRNYVPVYNILREQQYQSENNGSVNHKDSGTNHRSTYGKTHRKTDRKGNREAWKKLYIDFLNSLDDSTISGYQLIFIDDDDIPELAAPGISHIAPSYLCWVNDGKLCKGSMSFSGFKYLERQNKYLCEEGFTGKGWDYVRRINGDSEEEIARGETCNISGKESYVWNGVDYPNQDEYEAAKSRDFNKSEAQSVNNLKTYTDICAQIRDF